MLFFEEKAVVIKIHFAATVISTGQIKKFGPRKYHGLVYKVQGQAVYNIEGKRYCNKDKTIVYLPKGRAYVVEPWFEGVCIAVNFDLLDDTPEERLFDGALFDLENHETFYDLFRELEREWRVRRRGYHAKSLSILYQIIALLEQTIGLQHIPPYKYKRLKKALTYLEERYMDPALNISRLAAQCNMSEAYFRRCFKEAYQMSPIQYVKHLRINRAKDLLKSGLLTVSEVAVQVGYADIYYFSKAFKKAVGVNPSFYKSENEMEPFDA